MKRNLIGLAFLAIPALAVTQEDLFDEARLHTIRLEMKPADWQSLRENYLENTYYPATFHWRDQQVANAGVRSRGNTSRNGIKPGLRIDFNRYDKSQLFLGLASVALDNGIQDPSMMRERVAMAMFRRMNIPAPRAVHTLIYVNEEFVGLYILLDRIDNLFLKRHFETDAGDLYEFNRLTEYRFEYLGDDTKAYTGLFEPKNNNADVGALVNMIRDVNEANDADFAGIAARHLDYERLARYLAVENFISDIDGVTGEFGMNNFYLYRHPTTKHFEFIPWDKDFSLNGIDHAIDYNFEKSVLTRRMMSVPDFQQAYLRTLKDAAESAEGWLEPEVSRINSQIRQAVYSDSSQLCGDGEGSCSGEMFDLEYLFVSAYAQHRSLWVLDALPKP